MEVLISSGKLIGFGALTGEENTLNHFLLKQVM